MVASFANSRVMHSKVKAAKCSNEELLSCAASDDFYHVSYGGILQLREIVQNMEAR